MPRAGTLQANPDTWRLWDWWEETDEPLDYWTISQRLGEIHAGDDWALWVAGRHAGVYAIGTMASEPHLSDADDETGSRPPPAWCTASTWRRRTTCSTSRSRRRACRPTPASPAP